MYIRHLYFWRSAKVQSSISADARNCILPNSVCAPPKRRSDRSNERESLEMRVLVGE